MAEQVDEEDRLLVWLCTKRRKELSEFLVEISALQPAEKGEAWRKDYLNGLEDYFAKKKMEREKFVSTKDYMLRCFDFFNKKEYFEDEAEANKHWAIFVIGWIAHDIRAAIEQTNGLPDHSMTPMYG